MPGKSSGKVMVVDDDSFMLESISVLLRKQGFAVRCQTEAGPALDALRDEPVDVLLADINMPAMNGFRLLDQVRSFDAETPVVFITGNAHLDVAVSAVQMRAFDFIIKPFHPDTLIESLRRAVGHKRALETERRKKYLLEEAVAAKRAALAEALKAHRMLSREVLDKLTQAAEYRDEDTRVHIARIGRYARRLALTMGFDADFVETIADASPLHDIGKISVPDSILFKPGKLTSEEFEIIKTHTVIGGRILGHSRHPLLQMACNIAKTHHERWDGTGYPFGLRGEDIPLEGRIVMLCDQYDALRSRRAYKPPFDHARTVGIIRNGDGQTLPSHFAPAVLEAFGEAERHFAEIFDTNTEKAEPSCSVTPPPFARNAPLYL